MDLCFSKRQYTSTDWRTSELVLSMLIVEEFLPYLNEQDIEFDSEIPEANAAKAVMPTTYNLIKLAHISISI